MSVQEHVDWGSRPGPHGCDAMRRSTKLREINARGLRGGARIASWPGADNAFPAPSVGARPAPPEE